jgi:hypothetical protein
MDRFGPKSVNHPSLGEPCAACRRPFRVGDYTTLIPIGPGDDPEEQEKARQRRHITPLRSRFIGPALAAKRRQKMDSIENLEFSCMVLTILSLGLLTFRAAIDGAFLWVIYHFTFSFGLGVRHVSCSEPWCLRPAL